MLGTTTDCAECRDPGCPLANTLLACTSADGCARAACATGFGNCDTTSLDCEASFATGGTCLPSHRGTTGFATDYLYVSSTTIGTDGAFFLSGAFRGTLDFDPSDASDLHSAPALGTFITRFNADGSYAWTRGFPEPTIALGLALAPAAGGAVVAVSSFSGSVDLDPGPGVDQHVTGSDRQTPVIKLAADGALVWARTFEGTAERSFSSATGAAVDASDAVYLAGFFLSTVDFDPGPGTALRTTSSTQAGALVKLTPAGEFSWVQTVGGNEECGSSLTAVAVATDGTVWATGSACQAALFAAYAATGDARGLWRLPASESYSVGTALAAGANGSVYVGGAATGLVDLDPGPGVALRWTGDVLGGGFLLKLAPDASLLWSLALPGLGVAGLASTDDGGVLAVGQRRVAKLGPDGTPGWTFATENGDVEAVAAQGSRFVLAGAAGSRDSSDFDPGPGTQILDGSVRYLSRFDF